MNRTLRLLLRAAAIAWIISWWVWLIGHQSTFVEVDGQAYWGLRLEELYRGVRLGDQDAFLYSPAVALLFLPFSALPYDVFYALFAAINLAALVYLVGWELAAVSIFILPVSNEIARANIHLLMGVAIVIGFRHPAAWAWILLTKVTPGIGLVWFAVRREWRKLGISIGVTLVIVVATFVATPELWQRWVTVLVDSAGTTRPNVVTDLPLLPRLVVAAGLCGLAAWRGIPALIPVAALIALPAIWVNSLALLVAVIPLIRGRPAHGGGPGPDQLPIDVPGRSNRLAPDHSP